MNPAMNPAFAKFQRAMQLIHVHPAGEVCGWTCPKSAAARRFHEAVSGR